MEFKKKQPCKDCPYRKDAPLQHWDKCEFEKVLSQDEESGIMGSKVFGCHKKDESVCIGWLMDQRKRNLPSLHLRIMLSSKKVNYNYIESLKSPSKMYSSIREMIAANFPEII